MTRLILLALLTLCAPLYGLAEDSEEQDTTEELVTDSGTEHEVIWNDNTTAYTWSDQGDDVILVPTDQDTPILEFSLDAKIIVGVTKEQDAIACDHQGCVCLFYTENRWGVDVAEIQWRVAVDFIKKGKKRCQ